MISAVGIALLGAIGGLISAFLLPTRVLEVVPVRGASLLVSPLITGALMQLYGDWYERRGRERSVIGSFWGGALFAFAMAAVRFTLIAR